MAERTDYESEAYNQLMIDVNDVQHQYEIIGGYNYQGETEKILQGLGFHRNDFSKLTDTFSAAHLAADLSDLAADLGWLGRPRSNCAQVSL